MIIDGAQGGPNQDTLVTPKRAKKTQEQDDGNVQTNDKSLDEHDLDLDDEGGTYVGEVYIPPIAPVCFADPTGPRLIITKIVAFNFKSYAGYVTLGPFNTRFNAIIGPNGSGKSNVIDSMLFVFGYRASKIRANKLSVLMHKSDQVGGVSRCSVAIHFAQIIDKPNEEYEIIPGTDLEIARTAFYDNSSYYTLNGKKVHFKEVAKVLRDHGVDLLNNRFLILQGEVEQISMMPPKGKTEKETGLLEYLEEIIGTNRYKEPIAKMEVLYGKYDEERTEKLTRVQLVETDLKALEPELRKAVNFLELENCVQRKHNEIYQYERYVNMKNLGEHETKVQQMEQELTANLESIKKCTDEMESAKSELKTVEKEMGSKDSKVAQTEAAIEKAKIMIQKLNAEQKETEKRNTKAKDELKKEETKLKNLQKVPEANKAEIETLEAEKEELGEMKKQREERLQQVMASIASETASLQDKKNELQRVQIELRKGYDEAKSKCDIAKSELEIFLSTQSKETKKLADLEANLEKVQTTLTERKTLCEELTTRVPAMESEIAESRARLADLTREEAKLLDQVEKLAREVSEKRESMQTSRSNNRLIDFVMQLKSENRVSGILGRLGDLGGIDQKYDIAVSTACGALNYIVTETVEAGEAVIAAVKRQNVGRVNVIPLDKMQQYHSQCYDKYRTPENVPRLIDLIQVQDEKIRLAFYFATRETLVAQDLNQAKRIGYSGGGYRMVTLEGAIIEPSGTMSGGGSNPIRGLMGRKATVSTDTSLVKDLEVKEKRLASLETELRILSQQKMEVETQLNCTGNELKYKKQEYDTCLIDVKSLSEQAPELTKQIASQKVTLSKVSIDEAKRSSLEANVATLEKQMTESGQKVAELEAKVAAVHEDIMAISGGKTAALNTEIGELTSKLDKTKTRINKLHAGINANDRDVNKSTDKINNLREEIADTETKLESVRTKLANLQEELTTNETALAAYRTELKEIQKQYATLKKSFDSNNEELEHVQTKIKNATKELNEARKEMEGIQALVSKLEKKINNSSLHELLEITLVDGFIELKTSQSDPLRSFTPEELAQKTEEELRKELESIRAQFPEEVPNLTVVQTYKEKYELYMRRVTELHATTQERNKYRKGIMDTQKRRTHEFNAAFQLIADKVKETYQLLTTYGSADMSLDDNLNPFSQGINYAIRPPMKSWKYISNLSGGEKTIASLALVFALHYYKPSPLYFLDEIDAALDVRNVAIIGHYIKERTVNAQFIIISLRPECFDLADRIIGIYKVLNKSNAKAIDPKVLDVLNPHYKPYVRPELVPVQPLAVKEPQEKGRDGKMTQDGEKSTKDDEIPSRDSDKPLEGGEKTSEDDEIPSNEKEKLSKNREKAGQNSEKPSQETTKPQDAKSSNVKDSSNKNNRQNEKAATIEDGGPNVYSEGDVDEEMESTFEDVPARAHRKRKSTDGDKSSQRNGEGQDEPEAKKAKPSQEGKNEDKENRVKENGKKIEDNEKSDKGNEENQVKTNARSRKIIESEEENEEESDNDEETDNDEKTDNDEETENDEDMESDIPTRNERGGNGRGKKAVESEEEEEDVPTKNNRVANRRTKKTIDSEEEEKELEESREEEEVEQENNEEEDEEQQEEEKIEETRNKQRIKNRDKNKRGKAIESEEEEQEQDEKSEEEESEDEEKAEEEEVDREADFVDRRTRGKKVDNKGGKGRTLPKARGRRAIPDSEDGSEAEDFVEKRRGRRRGKVENDEQTKRES